MAILRKKEIRELPPEQIDKKLDELTQELNTERGTVASGGKASNPGRMKELRKTIARLITIKKEFEKNPVLRKVTEVKPKSKEEKKQPEKDKPNGVMKKNA